jgi:hypothetical protein
MSELEAQQASESLGDSEDQIEDVIPGEIDPQTLVTIPPPIDSWSLEKDKHKADTARILAYVLVGTFGGSFFLHFLAMYTAACNGFDKVAASMQASFGAWLPAISSLVSAAVTFYFTRETNKTSD